MLGYLTYFIFALTVGLASLGILTAIRLRKEFQNGFTSALIYCLIFIYAFGFYGIWGQAFIDKILTDYADAAVMEKIVALQTLIGLPFIIIGWYMMMRFALGLQQRKAGYVFTWVYLGVCISGLVIITYFSFSDKGMSDHFYILYYIILLCLIHIFTATILMLKPAAKTRIKRKKLNFMAFTIILSGMVQVISLCFIDLRSYSALIFVVLFFLSYTIIPLILRYFNILVLAIRKSDSEDGFDEFCHKYEISEREKDIIREMCKGSTNKEIADTLFISLQTVKDHTHRIYIKTGLRNRVELVNSIKNR